MSTSPAVTRPPSRSERLLRDTLRKDDTLRSSRPRSTSSTCQDDDDDDDDIFQSAILFRCSSRRNSAASTLGHPHPNGFYVPDQDEHASYARLLRSSSCSGSSRSGRSDRKTSPPVAYTQEKQGESSRHHDAAPHEAVLRSRLDAVMHSMRIDNDRDGVDALAHVQFSTASLPSSLGSTSNSRTHSHESHQTHRTVFDSDPCAPSTAHQRRFSPGEHRHTQSVSVVHTQPVSPRRTSSPRVPPQSPRTPRSPPGLPRTPTSQEKERMKRLHPDSPWMYAPLPPSPPAFSTSSPKRTGPAVVTFVATPPMVDSHTHMPTRSSARHSPVSSTTFDPDAASHALRQLPGYVSFASVAGLGAPPEEEDRRGGRKQFANFSLGAAKGRLSGIGLGSGKWWMF